MSQDRQDQPAEIKLENGSSSSVQPFEESQTGQHIEDYVYNEESPDYKNNVQKSNILSYLHFFFEFGTVKKAFQLSKKGEKLDSRSLPGLARDLRAEVMEEKLWKYYLERKKRKPKSTANLGIALIKVIQWRFILCLVLEIGLLCARIFSCYECYRLLKGLYEPTEPENEKWIWAAALSGTLLISLYIEHHLIFLKSVLPLYLRASLISMVYSKVSKLSIYALNQVSVGRIVNIVANDLNVFERAGMFCTCVLTGILGIIVGGALLWFWFGPVCLFGLGYMAINYCVQELLMIASKTPRNKQNGVTDTRIKITTELLEGIRLLKIYTWELAFGEDIKKVRKTEVGLLKSVHCLESTARGIAFSTQAMASYLIFMPYALLDNELSVTTVFPTFLVIGYLRIWGGFFFCMGLSFLSEVKLLLDRIARIMDIPEMEERTFEEPKNPENAVEFDNYTAYWTKEDADSFQIDKKQKNKNDQATHEIKPTLTNINMNIKKGSINALIGTVGSGKTSFLLSFTGEMPKNTGSLRYKGSVAYVGQEPIIFAGNFRENILFGKPYRPEFYKNVIKTCNLENDLKIFKDGDLSEIGEKGSNLSGGQKARLAFARAVYADADIYLLDDPLSAVDAKVAKSLYNDTIKTALKGKTVILSTHQVHFIKELENIMIIDQGTIVASGTFEDLKNQYAHVSKIFGPNQKNTSSEILPQRKESESQESQTDSIKEIQDENIEETEAKNNEDKEKKDEQGPRKPKSPSKNDDPFSNVTVGFRTYGAYFKEIGGFPFITLIIALFLCTEMATAGFGRMLGAWVTGVFVEWKSLAIVGGLAGFIFVIYIVKDIVFTTLLVKASQRFHTKMLDRIIRNPVHFFDTNPLGRILNRFSNDIGVLDRFLPISALDVVDLFFLVGNLVLTTAIIVPLTLAPVAIAFVSIILLLYFCYASISQSRNFDLSSRSPMYSLFSESLSGIVVVRLYHQTDNFTQKFRRYINNNTKGGIGFWTCARFFGFYVDVVYNLSAIGNIWILTALGGQGSGLTGLCLIFVLSITGVLQFALRQLIQTHVLMASVERVKVYCETKTEAALTLPHDEEVKKTGWPQEGKIEFNKVFMKYRPDANFVIKDLSLITQPGEKIGCVGRTGAGKSSIIQMLFRMVEIVRSEQDKETSYIKMDNIDIETMGLHLLRNSIAIIPQSPFVFTGTIRRNLDPFGQFSDEELWKALVDVGLKEHVESLENKLYTDMTNASSVFSVGQKQLICLARTILKNTKVLVLDEATANVDKQTDDFIQKTIMEKFSHCTIFTIAHRLSTIANYDKVLVLDKGERVEFDAPYKLLVKNIGDDTITNELGHFASMVLNTGPKTSQQILKIASEAYFSKHASE